MIFKDTHEQVLDGSKTQTRRLFEPNDLHVTIQWPIFDSTVFRNGRRKWEVGKTYAIQAGRGKLGKSLGRIRILSIRQERLQDISIVDCYAEGTVEVAEYPCDNPDEGSGNVNIREHFGKMWDGIHPKGKRWNANPYVWVLEFELVEDV